MTSKNIDKLYNKNYIIKGNLEVKKIESSNYMWDVKSKIIKTKTHTIKINNSEKKMISTDIQFKKYFKIYLVSIYDYLK